MPVLERLAGAQLLRDVADFLAAFDGMYAGFGDRADAVGTLLHSPEASFVVVTGPQPEPAAEAIALWRRLGEDGYPLGGVVVNRVHPLPPGPRPRLEALAAVLSGAGAEEGADLAGRALDSLDEARVLGVHDLDILEGLRLALNGPAVTVVPAFTRDPVDLDGLARVAAALMP